MTKEEEKDLTALAVAVDVYEEERLRKIAEWAYNASAVFVGVAAFYLVLMMVAMWS
ncbi:hypothetical protein [Corynebacterium ulcerans]|nr:hypothetical protein [Corynebacterium ulcerans]ESU59046.1 hypothetical protein D881_03025 [Corynebacterium ulcerans NCTC 12077]BAM26705.1 hypothetical protein CULC0102_0504 [Corynebacterium ulcerans 0102]BBJ71366.1 hypothetical protein CULC0211_05000 [Corynebacterium ulcerans]BBJ73673.1 hypothetical protein CULCFH20161_05000 [Corynebacterium ulcerans]BDV25245.1 hypothetical protein CULTSU28_04930 [Corynebacterium ulcerans]